MPRFFEDGSSLSDHGAEYRDDEEDHDDEETDTMAVLPPFPSPKPKPFSRVVSELDLNQKEPYSRSTLSPTHLHSHLSDPPIEVHSTDDDSTTASDVVPPCLLSPAFTPPATPGTGTPALQRPALSVPVDSTEDLHGEVELRKPRLVARLPSVNCVVGATIPTYAPAPFSLQLLND